MPTEVDSIIKQTLGAQQHQEIMRGAPPVPLPACGGVLQPLPLSLWSRQLPTLH